VAEELFVLSEASAFRLMREDDHRFVMNSWLKSHDEFKGKIGKPFYDVHAPIVNRLLACSSVKLVACDPSDPDLIQAWIVADLLPDGTSVVHYMYTKDVFRRLGIAHGLFQAATTRAKNVVCSHDCRIYSSVKSRHAEEVQLSYDPNAINVRV